MVILVAWCVVFVLWSPSILGAGVYFRKRSGRKRFSGVDEHKRKRYYLPAQASGFYVRSRSPL